MSDHRRAAKDAASNFDDQLNASCNQAAEENRNKFFTSEQCSGIVLHSPIDGRNKAEEPYNTEEEIAAMNDMDPHLLGNAASEQMANYLSHIAHHDMPLSAKIEMVSALHRIMSSFVDRAFGDDPIQHVHEMNPRDEKRIPTMVSSVNTTPDDNKASLSSASFSPASGKGLKERS